MDLRALNPYIRYVSNGPANSSWSLTERTIFDYEILYLKAGRLLVTVEDRQYDGIPGDIFLFKPGVRHSIRSVSDLPVQQPHVHFDLFDLPDSPEVRISFQMPELMSEKEISWFRRDVVSEAPFSLPDRFQLRSTLPFETILFAMIHEFEQKLPFYETTMKGLFTELWTYLLRENHWAQHPNLFSNMDELKLVKDYLDIHYTKDVNLDVLSKISNISKFHLIHVFKKAYGMTPMKYHQFMRIKKAKEVIQYTREPLKEIAVKYGFQTIHSFSRAFRQIEGVPPTYYRRKSVL
jgi:AraC-like DNA-binding protein